MGVGLLVGVWVARYLGPQQFGLLNFALAFTSLFGVIATLGLQGIVVRDMLRDPESARLTLGTTALMQMVGGLVTFLLILSGIAYLRPDDTLARTIVGILGAMMMFKISEIAVYWFESQVQSKYTVMVQNGVFLVFAGIKVGLILSHASLTTFVWAMLAEAAVVAILLLIVFNMHGIAIVELQASLSRAKTLLNDSWMLILSSIAIVVYLRIDQIMLGQMVGDEAVGIYSAATRITEIWQFIPAILVSSIFPSIAALRDKDRSRYHQKIQNIYDILSLLSISVGFLMIFISDEIVLLLFGSAYKDASVILVIHVWSAVFIFLLFSSGRWLIEEGLQLLALKRNIYGLITNIGLNLILIPMYGAIGAAWATLISSACAGLFSDLLDSRTRFKFWMKIKSIFLINFSLYLLSCLAKQRKA